MRIVLTCVAAAALVLGAACGDDSGDGGEPTRTDAFYATGTAGAASDATSEPEATTATDSTPEPAATQGGTPQMYSAEPPMTIDQNKRYFATIKMDIGDIKLELFAKDAPRHVNSFVFLAREGFYDGLIFHRVIPGFVAQGGDPTGTGSGGPGYNIPLEVNPNKFEDGSLGMARSQAPDSAGSQWFIDYAPQPNLDGSYTVFGKVVEGRDVLDKIAPGQPPANPTVMNTIIIEEE